MCPYLQHDLFDIVIEAMPKVVLDKPVLADGAVHIDGSFTLEHSVPKCSLRLRSFLRGRAVNQRLER